jgi:pimeloyl-ACP methyl ester carboxylesterase
MKTVIFFLLALMATTNAVAQKDGDHGYADVNGIKLYYEIHGSGSSNGAPPLVLLHGGLMNSALWGATLPALAQHHTVIAVDLQGHGRTADIDRPFSVEALGDDVAGLIKYLKIEKADIMGYSLGAGAAMQVAVRHPELVHKLVLASAIIRRTDFYPEILAQQSQMGSQAAEQMKQTPMYQSYASLNPHPEDWSRLLDKLGAFMKKDYDFSEQVKQIKAPTLIVAGDADIFPTKYAVRMFELLGGSQKDPGWDGSGRSQNQLAILPGVTHYTMGIAPALAPTALAFLDAPNSSKQATKQ